MMKTYSWRIQTILFLTSVAELLDVAWSHGYLTDPPARASAWRYGFNTPINYDDNALYCGGFGVQFNAENGGKCGICGDAYSLPQPRPNEGGGTYGLGVIVGQYVQGGVVTARVKITAHHKGAFEFSLCRHNSPHTHADEACFVKLHLVDESGTSYKVPAYYRVPIIYMVQVKLPDDIICDQCVFRWIYRAGNNWGCDEAGMCGLGLGNQEHFFGCSDIRIVPRADSDPPSPTIPQPSDYPNEAPARTTQPSPATTGRTATIPIPTGREYCDNCRPTFRWLLTAGMTQWCIDNCRLGNYEANVYEIRSMCIC